MATGERSNERERRLSCQRIVHLTLVNSEDGNGREGISTKVCAWGGRLLAEWKHVLLRGDLDGDRVLAPVYM